MNEKPNVLDDKVANVEKDSRDKRKKKIDLLGQLKVGFSRCHNPHHMPCHRDFEWACLQHSVAIAARILVGKDMLEEILFYFPTKYLHKSDLQEV